MALFLLRLLALLTFVDFSLCQWSMDGKTQTFTFVTNKRGNDPQLTWILYNGNTNTSYFVCTTSYEIGCVLVLDTLKDFFSANITSNSTSYISVFTINNVNLSLHNTRWFCSADFQSGFKESVGFDLHLFAAAESPTCDKVKLINEINIQINCSTTKVFPGSLCLFTVKSNTTSEYELKQGDISYTQDQNLTTLYYKTTCTLVVSAAILGPGSHIVRVFMYPNITSDVTEEMKRTSDNTTSIYLGYPKAALETECIERSYIMENIKSICTCYDENHSILPTNIHWLTNQSILTANGTLVFTTKRHESFQCEISNHLNWTDKIVFQPNISYPPDLLTVNITQQVLDLCNQTSIVISGTCFVSESNPEPSITVNMNDSLIDTTPSKRNVGYIFNNTVSSAGIYNFSCFANSREYSKNVSSKATTVTVKGPPSILEIFQNENKEMKIHENNLLKITKGDTITCQAKGGYPILMNISLKCGPEETHAANTVQVSMTFNISNVTSGKCECIVWHDSNCLQTTSTTVHFKVYGVNAVVVLENSPLKDQDFEKIYLGVGVAAGGFVVIVALIFIFNNLHQDLLKKTSSGMSDKLVNNADVYFINEEKSGIDLSIYPEYTNVVTTMSSALEAPKNLKK